MPQYRKKPVVIEARQWNQESAADICQWTGCAMRTYPKAGPILIIETLEGTMHAVTDDWVIKGVKGEFYPCKPEIFEATYERECGGPFDCDIQMDHRHPR